MIGPQLRKGLRWAAIVLMLFGPVMSGLHLHEMMNRPDFQLIGSRLDTWLAALVGIASTVVQGGVLLVLLSIDERIEKRSL